MSVLAGSRRDFMKYAASSVLLLALAVVRPITGQSKEPAGGAVVPVALYAQPLGADPGKRTKLTLRGVAVDGATDVRMGDPKSTARLLGKGRKVNVPASLNAQVVGDSEVDVEVSIPTEVPGGLVTLVLVGPGGPGKPMNLAVNGETPRTPEKEPNDGFKMAMPVAVPQIVEAAFQQGQDPDVYRVAGKAGEVLWIEIQASRYGSPANAMFTLHDADGRTVDTGAIPAGGSDPVLRTTLPRDGHYYISVLEGFDQGGSIFVYRLLVRREP